MRGVAHYEKHSKNLNVGKYYSASPIPLVFGRAAEREVDNIKFHSELDMNGELLTGDATPQAVFPQSPK